MQRTNSQPDLRPLRPILPSPAGAQRGSPVPPKRAIRVSSACESCRLRKTRCDGVRPRCGECASRNTDCQYKETEARQIRRRFEQLREKRTSHEQLLDMLQTLPEKDALEVFRRLRAGGNAESIVRHVQEGNLLMELSAAPDMRLRREIPYIAKMPPALLTPENHYLQLLLNGAVQLSAGSMAMNASGQNRDTNPPLKPFHTAELVEPLLVNTKPSEWTTISSNDRLMRSLIEGYFLNEYPSIFPLHKDYFLQDLLSGDPRFCSPLLVNALLAKACTTSRMLPNRAKFWDPDNLAYRFLAEARRLWELEEGEPKLTTIQAGCLIDAAMVVNGHDRLGSLYTTQALDMAERMGLFEQDQSHDHKFEHAKVFTAWGLANWQTVQSYYYFKPPHMPEMPPHPLPNVDEESDWYGEVRLRYYLDQEIYSIGFGHGMKALSELRKIMNDISVMSFGRPTGSTKITWEQALHFHKRLQAWYNTLPDLISHTKLLFPAHLKLHCEYHSTLIMLFSSQLSTSNMATDALTSNQRGMAQSTVKSSMIQLESLLRIYYLRHSFESYDSLLVVFLAHIAQETCTRLSRIYRQDSDYSNDDFDALRSTLILCLKGLHDQGKNFHVSCLIFDVLKRKLSTEDQSLVDQYVTSRDGESEHEVVDRSQRVISDFVMPMVHLHEDPWTARLSNLVQ